MSDNLFAHATCEETTAPVAENNHGFVDTEYIDLRCGRPATAVVLSERGKRLYFMCEPCAEHNVQNRGAVPIAIMRMAR